MTNSLKLSSKIWKDEYINIIVYPIYIVLTGRNNVVLVGSDKDKGKNIDDLFYILYKLLKW